MGRIDERDFHDFVVARSSSLARLARLLSSDPHAGEDLLQSTLLKTWSAWPRVARAENPDAYVRRVMVNTAAKGLRRRWRGEVPTETLPDVAGPDASHTVDERDALTIAVRRLPPRQRAAVVLRYFADLDDQEIADALECSVATVRSQISRALAALRVRSADDALSPKEATS
jgi:RNA polymerase sigma-70 factor (sigma-E family)